MLWFDCVMNFRNEEACLSFFAGNGQSCIVYWTKFKHSVAKDKGA